jgi:hypothetical protein
MSSRQVPDLRTARDSLVESAKGTATWADFVDSLIRAPTRIIRKNSRDIMKPALPKQLRYMRPFLRYLESLPAEDLNEDVDPTILESALRKRLATGDPDKTLDDDRRVLDEWLDSFDSQTHPAHWISGYILNLSPSDLQDVEERHESQVPMIEIEPPTGWTVSDDGSLLRKGELFAAIQPVDTATISVLQRQMAVAPIMPPPIVAQRIAEPVTFGAVTGNKYLYSQSLPRPWKQVDYLLEVPGGFVMVKVCAMGAEFDEREVEDRLCTLSVRPPTA